MTECTRLGRLSLRELNISHGFRLYPAYYYKVVGWVCFAVIFIPGRSKTWRALDDIQIEGEWSIRFGYSSSREERRKTHQVKIMPGFRTLFTREEVVTDCYGTPRTVTTTSSKLKSVSRIHVCRMGLSSQESAATLPALHPERKGQ